MASKKENRRRACKTCNSGVCHDCRNCGQRTRGRPRKQLKLQMSSAPAMSMGIVTESVVPWSISTVHPAAPAAADTVFLSPAILATVPTAVPATVPTAVPATVSTAVRANVSTAIPANVPTAVPANVPAAVPATVHTAVPANVSTAIPATAVPATVHTC